MENKIPIKGINQNKLKSVADKWAEWLESPENRVDTNKNTVKIIFLLIIFIYKVYYSVN